MNSRVKITKLIIQGLRGVRKAVPLDFEDNKSIVLFGNNGDGKSSFSDALEWFYTDKIDYLKRKEGCGREDYFNKYMDSEEDAVVQLEFNNSLINSQKKLKRKGGQDFSNTSNEFSEYIENSLHDSVILRHHTMREFVDKTKKEKLEKLEEIIGFSIVKEVREVLLKSLNALKDNRQLTSLKGQLEERKRDLTSAVKNDNFQEVDIIAWADQHVKNCDPSLSVVDMDCFKSITGELDKKVRESGKGKMLARLDGLCDYIRKLAAFGDTVKRITIVLKSHNTLAQKSEIIKASAIEKLYSAAIEAMEDKLVKPGECPICKKPVDTESLIISLKGDIEKIKDVLKKRDQTIRVTNKLISKLSKYKASISNLLSDEFTKLQQLINDIKSILTSLENILQEISKSPECIQIPVFSINFNNLNDELNIITKQIEEKKTSQRISDEDKKFYTNVNTLKKLYEDYVRYNDLSRNITVWNSQIDTMATIYSDFECLERESIKAVLKSISTDVNDFFKFLHPDDDFDRIELNPTDERGIEFKLKYHGLEVTPPMKILSEAHLNSLGICLFLASAKLFNKINGFVVLDDVVTSFDINHRRPLARLLENKFADVQFLLFTHDDLWFEMLKKDLRPENWLFKELLKWTKENGCDLKDSPITLKERIKNSLDENDISGAANKCRILIEAILKDKCEKLGVRGLEFRTGVRNEQREANELINVLTAYLKNNETLRNKESKTVFNQMRASQLITNIGSHDRSLQTTGLSRGDIETILRDINEFELLFICKDCNKEPSIKYTVRNSQLKQCKCGKLWI